MLSEGKPLKSAVEILLMQVTQRLLLDSNITQNFTLKSVELANKLRVLLGPEILAYVRDEFNGLLTLLERHNNYFNVRRIPKDDHVILVNVLTLKPDELLKYAHIWHGIEESMAKNVNIESSDDDNNDNNERIPNYFIEHPELSFILSYVKFTQSLKKNTNSGIDEHNSSKNQHSEKNQPSRCLHIGNIYKIL